MLSNWISRSRDRSGQALVEFMFVAVILLVMLFGMIDFCRAISTRQVLINLSREGANIAARGPGDIADSMSNAVQAVITAANPLDITANGRVIVTAVFNSNGTFRITNQLSSGALTSASSKIGVVNATGNAVKLPDTPSTAGTIPQPNQTLFATEVFYAFKPTTPIGQLINISMTNAPMYDAAYF
jgi:Flp pilus assembly protein TadG